MGARRGRGLEEEEEGLHWRKVPGAEEEEEEGEKREL